MYLFIYLFILHIRSFNLRPSQVSILDLLKETVRHNATRNANKILKCLEHLRL